MQRYFSKGSGVCLLILSCFFISSCSTTKRINYKRPESVSLAFIRAIATLDIDKANKVATKDTKEVLSLLGTMKEGMPEEEKEAIKEEATKELEYIKKAKCIKKSDTKATCTICCNKEGETTESPIVLKKVGDKWLVDMSKEQLVNQKEE